ncbi:MAG: hypothetical protein NTU79_10535 [Planctomycetota bacterium]|nr:hypothetical protein [Planctomycetota bacterium]
MLNRSLVAGSFVAAIVVVGSTGCQSNPLSMLGAQNSAKPAITDRQISLSQTPIALAKKDAGSPSIKSNADPSAAQGVQPVQPVQPASANSPQTPAQNALRTPQPNAEEIQNAVYTPRGGATASQVFPAQYKPDRYAPIGPTRGSENVPRVAMATPAMAMPPGMAVPPGVNIPSMNVPRTPMAGPPGPQGHVHTGSNCACKHGTGAYRPVFPRLSGNSGCSACGVAACSGECGGVMVEQGCAVPRTSDPQEYIFDGGDHDPQVRLKADLTQVGLDPEDTVIQYETLDGKTSVVSGCRVSVYAPRFASVRKRQSTQESELAMRLRTAERPDGPGVIRDQLPSAKVSQPLKSMNSENVRIVEAFRERNRPIPAELILPAVTISDTFKLYEDFSLIRNGDLKMTDLAKLAKSAAAARTWTNVDELNVLIDGQEAIENVTIQRAADVTIYEYKGARIRLCKVASEQMANPGDIISFTIRFDNVGEQPLKSLVITDSLAPRLEYLDKSQQASVPADFSISANNAGSSVLRWELENGLKPGEGGLVRFSCKVR